MCSIILQLYLYIYIIVTHFTFFYSVILLLYWNILVLDGQAGGGDGGEYNLLHLLLSYQRRGGGLLLVLGDQEQGVEGREGGECSWPGGHWDEGGRSQPRWRGAPCIGPPCAHPSFPHAALGALLILLQPTAPGRPSRSRALSRSPTLMLALMSVVYVTL